jgi:hypothetical protein
MSNRFIYRCIAWGVIILVAGVYYAWPGLVRWDADDEQGDVALWIHDADATPGDAIHARVRVDTGLRVAIESVVVEGAGGAQTFDGTGADWGNELQHRNSDRAGTDALDFVVQLPTAVDQAKGLDLEIAVTTIVAHEQLGTGTFTDDKDRTVFHRHVDLHSARKSVIRRAGRATIVLGAAAIVVALGVLWLRRRIRCNRRPTNSWVLYLAPHALVGYFVIARQLSIAARVHASWFTAACMLLWFAILVLPSRLTARYNARQTILPALPIAAVEQAWLAAGLDVERARGELVVTLQHVGTARVRVRSAGAPLEIASRDPQLVATMVQALAPLR